MSKHKQKPDGWNTRSCETCRGCLIGLQNGYGCITHGFEDWEPMEPGTFGPSAGRWRPERRTGPGGGVE